MDPTREGTTRSTDFRAKRSGCGGPSAMFVGSVLRVGGAERFADRREARRRRPMTVGARVRQAAARGGPWGVHARPFVERAGPPNTRGPPATEGDPRQPARRRELADDRTSLLRGTARRAA